jgi:RHS repeat-associated protein
VEQLGIDRPVRIESGRQAPRLSPLLRAWGLAAILACAAGAIASAFAAAGPSPDPARAQLAALHLPEPLVATGSTSAAEDAALLAAATHYRHRADPDDFSALTGFLSVYPHSAWRVAVLTNLGIDYRHYGYFSRALAAWSAAWRDGRDAADREARALVDRAAGELVRIEVELGYRDRLAALLEEIGNRPVSGAATELVQLGRETLWVMRTDPKHLYTCGPTALKMLLLAQHARYSEVDFLNWVRADGPQGTSLAEVAELSHRTEAPLVPVFRKPSERAPVPSIVHWRVGHFAAIVAMRNGRYEVKDPTFGHQELWVTQGALDAEASGYFLVSEKAAQAAGWRLVGTPEAGRVWGAGPTTDDSGNPNCGMCGYAINEQKVSLHLIDTPVGYAPPKGPSAQVTLNYAQRDQNQPAKFGFFNVSQKWTINWLSYVTDEPGSPGTNVTRYLRDGGLYSYTGYDTGTGRFAAQEDDLSVLQLTSASPITYRHSLPDGSIEVYAESDGSAVSSRNIFLSRIIDPQGNVLTLDYGRISSQVRLLSLTDATGRKTTFGYGSPTSPLLITKITDPFGRSAILRYDGSGRLVSITDVLGLTSKFTYDASSLVNSLTTPYGTSHFAYGGSGNRRFLNITDPRGFGEREETFQPAPVPGFEPPYYVPQGMTNLTNNFLVFRDSFHWNAHQYAVAGCTPNGGCNYGDARVTHFTHDAANISLEWDTVESSKEPLENRVWYTYPGQPAGHISGTYDEPNAIGRVLDDGGTQLTQFAYNAFGNPTQYVDPVGRTTTLAYAANNIDVDTVAQTVAGTARAVAAFTYNDHHRPLTYTDAAGQTTHYRYDGAGQLTSVTNALGQETSYDYNSTGDLTKIINADGKVAASFTYDAFDRIASYTDSEGWTVKYAYDAGDRLTLSTYPDGTTDEYGYDKLDLAVYTDRQKHSWHYAYDPDRRLTKVTDPLGQTTKYTYFEDGTLQSLTDPNGHVTRWDVDIESRPIAKHYADGSVTTYQYESTTSRLKSVTDALGQSKDYSYTVDDRIAGIGYQNAVNPTPAVRFTYDPYFSRLAAMQDGSGTTAYSYVPIGAPGALQLDSESGPLPNGKISYAYDALGRVVGRTVGGAPPETFAYDRIGRLRGHSDALGTFALGYLGETGQPTKRQLVGGSVATAWSYLSNINDRRLKSIVNTPGREFDYTTTREDLITQIAEKRSGKPAQNWSLVYDSDHRLSSADLSTGAKYRYSLDAAGNITRFQAPSGTSTAVYNKVNELSEFRSKPFDYDRDGNLFSDGARNYAWDAENRLIGITQAGSRSSFAYDGLGRRVAITGQAGSARYLWCGLRICQSRNGPTAIRRLYYPEGEVAPGSKAFFYYGPDQLGSVRDVYGKSPMFSVVQSYDYDPYGNPTKTPRSGPTTDVRYAGMFYHADSALYLTQYRAYDPRIGRWLSRDPLGEFPVQFRATEAVPPSLPQLRYAPEELASARGNVLSRTLTFPFLQNDEPEPDGSGMAQSSASEPLLDYRNAGSFPVAFGVFHSWPSRAYEPRLGSKPSLGPIEETGGQALYSYVDGDPVNATDLAGLQGGETPMDRPRPCPDPIPNPCQGLSWLDCLLWHMSNDNAPKLK